MEAIILAGGMGTRLRSVVSDIPKCMAPVAGKPFLYYLLATLEKAGFEHIILSLGYKHHDIEDWLDTLSFSMRISFVVEKEPLGTGGAVKYALSQAEQSDIFILNGDTFLGVDYAGMLELHQQTKALATLALKRMEDFDRYGVVEMDASCQITRFLEKQPCTDGLINGGTYLIRKESLETYPDKFSLEKDFFEKRVSTDMLAGFSSDGYFIDIGIPEDYIRAQKDFKDGKYKTL
ncbi:D-glycero-alpha-D-manno-heptose 1-phosphate guanylyltransferase [Parabacteroides sp. PF5-5]|uniref:nucleotidyltransferase family protein n=1 Tax=unclassified Parabacteroides TaxID=2649774 RepID=UPI002476876B|nr:MULTISPECIES: nucleotidyltransferase family protein [unclassified Parabacteroides]MDH6306795.1 D-glycero-alpha-D-manno-heptose 1-phosphate guanylyltransferase [Parabacteroides sp. PH5-39]MDH6317681.1 D-glycero-alpha-D-manno-heptose 1-phosphate guanylyltransferase [Parabacteroides sp. PF5-13]MDH6321507.1 D-glycero-alpha-D-manno-heptose 1-phosphate guanylyltransferase [Parabacteroides sp. PH5-13]MDH6325216.1 D-glycero-alpha-D-manno-heptose 1-phosphate guanylyltransferase [Parabacteroides sp. P